VADNDASKQISQGASRWLADFEKVLNTKDSALLERLFLEKSYWRDQVAFTWDYRQVHNRADIEELLWSVVDEIKPSNFRFAEKWPAPDVFEGLGTPLIEVFFDFDTASGWGTGIVRGVPNEDSPYGFDGYTLYTKLEGLNGVEPPAKYPRGHGFKPEHKDENWLQSREKKQSFEDRDPTVLIAGGGHSGMVAAAYLARLGVESLIVDKNERVGDNWRKRYHTLALHNPIEMNQLPFMDYPDNFPQYIPKDKLANWFETYAESLDLNFWTSTEFLGASYDEETGVWTATVRKADGTERVLHPKHVIMATGGVGGPPRIPKLAGLDSFSGTVMHSSKFTAGQDYPSKKAIVVGVGTSAHDIALDLYNNGTEVTMLQRNPVIVTSVDCANLAYNDYFLGIPADLVDIRGLASGIYPLMVEGMKGYQKTVAELDRPLLERLEAAGVKLEEGEDKTGWLIKFLRYGGGYYLNVGASDVIAEGGIKVRQFADVDTFVPEGAQFKDGSVLEADLIVLATGYENRSAEVAHYFGEDVAQRIGDIGGFDEQGELANAWKPTAQRGLWFMIGSMQQARGNAPQLALQIKADLEGLIPESLRKTSQSSPASVSA